MHIISRKALRAFAQRHPDSATALDAWFRIVKTNRFASFHELRRVFALIAAVHFNRQKVYIRHVLTHEEYDRGAWKQ